MIILDHAGATESPNECLILGRATAGSKEAPERILRLS
jgi:hypothetical protein